MGRQVTNIYFKRYDFETEGPENYEGQYSGVYQEPLERTSMDVPYENPVSLIVSNIGQEENLDDFSRREAEAQHIENDNDLQVLLRRRSVFEDPKKFKNKEAPTIITPVDTTFLENYFIFLVAIFHEIPVFRNIVLSKGFEDYGYKPQWWKDEVIHTKAELYKDDTKEYNLKFLMELQRSLAFLDGNISKRNFASTKNLARSIPKNVSIALETEVLSDVFPLFYQSIISQVGIFNPNAKNPISNLFESVVGQNHESTSASIFQIEADFVRPTLYETFHSLFWQDNFQGLGNTLFIQLSDILTISYQDIPSSHAFAGVLVDEKFYPQIYTKECVPYIKSMVDEQISLATKLREVSRENGSLVSYQGKRITSFLENTIKYLQNVSGSTDTTSDLNNELLNASQDLASLEEGIKSRKSELVAKNFELESLSSSNNVHDIANVLKYIEKSQKRKLMENLIDLSGDSDDSDKSESVNISSTSEKQVENGPEGIITEPYVLVGVIINELEFYYQLNGANSKYPNQWVYLVFEGEPKTSNFSAEATSFSDVQQHIKKLTKNQMADTLVLIYAKESLLVEKNTLDIPEPLKVFLNKDNENLEATLDEVDDIYSDKSE